MFLGRLGWLCSTNREDRPSAAALFSCFIYSEIPDDHCLTGIQDAVMKKRKKVWAMWVVKLHFVFTSCRSTNQRATFLSVVGWRDSPAKTGALPHRSMENYLAHTLIRMCPSGVSVRGRPAWSSQSGVLLFTPDDRPGLEITLYTGQLSRFRNQPF